MSATQQPIADATDAAGAPESHDDLTVYEVFHGGGGFERRRVGLFVDVAAGQRGAEEEFRTWLDAMDDMSTAEVVEDTEVIATELVWAVEQHYLHGHDDIPIGEPVPTAHYSPGRFFTVEPIAVRS